MKVKALIEHLETFNPEATVYVDIDEDVGFFIFDCYEKDKEMIKLNSDVDTVVIISAL
jgi:hypothetical protein